MRSSRGKAPVAELATGAEGWSSGLLDRRDVELEVDLLAHEDAAGLQGGVPVHAPVLAVDGGLALEADALVAERVDGRAGVGEVDRDGLGRALDGEVTGDPVLGVAELLDLGAAERDLRVGVHVEEVVAPQVRV